MIFVAPPTRLVRVQTLGHGSSSEIVASLCEMKSLLPAVACQYTTLSHRWADSTTVRLDEGNLSKFRHTIPIDQLPILFKDAMHMTYELGIKYIWIDCLCILQGSKEDWEREAARMGDYYRYAQCNLSASGYEGSSMGLFSERTALSFLNYPIRTDCVLASKRSETRYEGIYIRTNEDDFSDDIIHGPLGSRGWVAQERALSPGILHFTQRQMWWECTERITNEAFPIINLPWTHSQGLGAGAVRSISAGSSLDDIYESWHNFVKHYATTKLTFETDRFPALIGIARVYGTLLNDNFIAGMWEGDLLRSLLWTNLWGEKAGRMRPAHSIAPSWSWASLCSVPVVPLRGSPISGVCFQVLSKVPNFRSDLQTATFQRSKVRGLAMTAPLRRLSSHLYDLPRWEEFARLFTTEYDVEDASHISEQDIVGQEWRWDGHTHILPLWKAGRANGTIEIRGLLLQEASAAELQDSFRRLGTVEIHFHSEESCEKYLGLVKENGVYKPSVDFEECGLQEIILI